MWILAGVVRLVAPFGPLQLLVLLHQVPPQLVQVLLGIVVQRLLEAEHHLAPAGEDQQLVAPHAWPPAASKRSGSGTVTPIAASQSALSAKLLEHHRHAFGGQDVRLGPQARRAALGGMFLLE